jgi:hypothetical protein
MISTIIIEGDGMRRKVVEWIRGLRWTVKLAALMIVFFSIVWLVGVIPYYLWVRG